jgi:hypothetical protein
VSSFPAWSYSAVEDIAMDNDANLLILRVFEMSADQDAASTQKN